MKLDEGQLDFFNLLNEYTDGQGASVRVKKPSGKLMKSVETQQSFTVKDAQPAEKKAVAKPTVSSTVDKNAPVEKIVLSKIEKTKKNVPTELPKTEKAAVAETKKAPTQVEIPKTVTAPKPETPPEPETVSEPVVVKKTEQEKKEMSGVSSEILFKQCKKCWCFDCRHNSRNEGVPREMCGNMIPCPACKGCIDEDQATICEIGNAKEGCRLRAVEEGILIPESM